MEHTMLIELTNQKAAGLLRELEELNLIRVLEDNTSVSKKNLSKKYRGILSQQEGGELKDHIRQMRNEWNDM